MLEVINPWRVSQHCSRKYAAAPAAHYYNGERSYWGIDAITPIQKADTTSSKIISLAAYRWQKYCRGLYQLPAAA